MLKTSILECEQDYEQVATAEISELLLMALQQYVKENGQKSVLQVLKDKWRKYDRVENLKTSAHGCVQDGK